jgi:Tol biopolymer transport system component
MSNRTGDHEIYIINADGSGLQRLTYSPGLDWEPDVR